VRVSHAILSHTAGSPSLRLLGRRAACRSRPCAARRGRGCRARARTWDARRRRRRGARCKGACRYKPTPSLPFPVPLPLPSVPRPRTTGAAQQGDTPARPADAAAARACSTRQRRRVSLNASPALPLPPRTKWTRRVPHPVLIGHVASAPPGVRRRGSHHRRRRDRVPRPAARGGARGGPAVDGVRRGGDFRGWAGRGRGRGGRLGAGDPGDVAFGVGRAGVAQLRVIVILGHLGYNLSYFPSALELQYPLT
jgi:hypothetical protein